MLLPLSLLANTKEKIIFPFRIENENGRFYKRNIDKNLLTKLYVGNLQVKIPLSIKLRQYLLLLADGTSNVRKDIPRFYSEKSITFAEVWEEGILYEEEYFSSGFKASDYFSFGKENVSKTFYFILVREAKKKISVEF
jgi:hypothetical protein